MRREVDPRETWVDRPAVRCRFSAILGGSIRRNPPRRFRLAVYITATGIVLLASTFLLAVFFLFLYRLKRQEYLFAWATAWLLLSMHFIAGVIAATAAPGAFL